MVSSHHPCPAGLCLPCWYSRTGPKPPSHRSSPRTSSTKTATCASDHLRDPSPLGPTLLSPALWCEAGTSLVIMAKAPPVLGQPVPQQSSSQSRIGGRLSPMTNGSLKRPLFMDWRERLALLISGVFFSSNGLMKNARWETLRLRHSCLSCSSVPHLTRKERLA